MLDKDIKEIKKLINLNEDARQFYTEASEQTDSATYRSTFQKVGALHGSVVVSLQSHLKTLGETDLQPDKTLMGKTRQFVGTTLADWSEKTDEMLVTHLEEAEDRCLHQIQDIMEDEDITTATKDVLTREHANIRQTHDYMKGLKDNLKKAA